MAVQYDPSVISAHADRLYARAAALVTTYMVACGSVGLLVFGVPTLQIDSELKLVALPLALLGGALGAFIGRALATERAEQMKLQAQTALCQVKIEEHARVARAKFEGAPYP